MKAKLISKTTQILFISAACMLLLACERQSIKSPQEYPGVLHVGHLVGICMSPLFVAYSKGYFSDEGLDVKLQWTTNPGDAINLLTTDSLQFTHGSFLATYRAVDQGSELRIVAGSGNHGLSCIARGDSGIKTLSDLAARKNTGLKVGSQRLNNLELAFYSLIKKLGLSYKDFDMVYFHDHFTMQTAFEKNEVSVVTHVEPYATMLTDRMNGVRIGDSQDAWGKGSPDCVVSVRADFLEKYPVTVKKYIRAILRGDAFVKQHLQEAIELLDKNKFYRVDKDILAAAIPRQPPGVDLRAGVPAMLNAVKDAVDLGYLKEVPERVVDLRLLNEVVHEKP